MFVGITDVKLHPYSSCDKTMAKKGRRRHIPRYGGGRFGKAGGKSKQDEIGMKTQKAQRVSARRQLTAVYYKSACSVLLKQSRESIHSQEHFALVTCQLIEDSFQQRKQIPKCLNFSCSWKKTAPLPCSSG